MSSSDNSSHSDVLSYDDLGAVRATAIRWGHEWHCVRAAATTATWPGPRIRANVSTVSTTAHVGETMRPRAASEVIVTKALSAASLETTMQPRTGAGAATATASSAVCLASTSRPSEVAEATVPTPSSASTMHPTAGGGAATATASSAVGLTSPTRPSAVVKSFVLSPSTTERLQRRRRNILDSNTSSNDVKSVIIIGAPIIRPSARTGPAAATDSSAASLRQRDNSDASGPLSNDDTALNRSRNDHVKSVITITSPTMLPSVRTSAAATTESSTVRLASATRPSAVAGVTVPSPSSSARLGRRGNSVASDTSSNDNTAPTWIWSDNDKSVFAITSPKIRPSARAGPAAATELSAASLRQRDNSDASGPLSNDDTALNRIRNDHVKSDITITSPTMLPSVRTSAAATTESSAVRLASTTRLSAGTGATISSPSSAARLGRRGNSVASDTSSNDNTAPTWIWSDNDKSVFAIASPTIRPSTRKEAATATESSTVRLASTMRPSAGAGVTVPSSSSAACLGQRGNSVASDISSNDDAVPTRIRSDRVNSVISITSPTIRPSAVARTATITMPSVARLASTTRPSVAGATSATAVSAVRVASTMRPSAIARAAAATTPSAVLLPPTMRPSAENRTAAGIAISAARQASTARLSLVTGATALTTLSATRLRRRGNSVASDTSSNDDVAPNKIRSNRLNSVISITSPMTRTSTDAEVATPPVPSAAFLAATTRLPAVAGAAAVTSSAARLASITRSSAEAGAAAPTTSSAARLSLTKRPSAVAVAARATASSTGRVALTTRSSVGAGAAAATTSSAARLAPTTRSSAAAGATTTTASPTGGRARTRLSLVGAEAAAATSSLAIRQSATTLLLVGAEAVASRMMSVEPSATTTRPQAGDGIAALTSSPAIHRAATTMILVGAGVVASTVLSDTTSYYSPSDDISQP
ncbi:mucin-5AC-like [Phymastichus coffea]|uniref:mucin-5AC-like n=1 Tax=Phymastichus coffea TaxID=108790 RepID=UPI00273BEB07|nr:mucin-5AC-like [Phymastichus coffea]